MGKLFSRGHFEFFSFFFLKTNFDILCQLSSEKNLHKMSNSISLKKIRKLS